MRGLSPQPPPNATPFVREMSPPGMNCRQCTQLICRAFADIASSVEPRPTRCFIRPADVPCRRADVRAKANFLSRINVIWVVQSLLKKYSAFQKQKTILYPHPSRPTEGRWPSSLTRGGMRWTRMALLTGALDADGDVVGGCDLSRW